MRASRGPHPLLTPLWGGLGLKMLADPSPPGWSLSCAAASGHPASVPHVMARPSPNETGVMGEEEALLRGLHFLELMTSLRVAGTGPLTPSGSFRAHHSPAGMQRGGAGGREGLGKWGPSPGGLWGLQEVGTRGDSSVFASTPLWLFLLPPSPPLL